MLTRRSLLGTCAASLLLPAAARAASASPKRLVVVFAPGGWDVSYVFDPKLGVPTIEGPEVDMNPLNPNDVEEVQTFSGIPIAVNELKRPHVSQFFARWGSRATVVNGIQVGTLSHQLGRLRMLTGVQTSTPGPDLAVIAGAVHGADLPAGSMAMSGYSSASQLAATTVSVGARNQLDALLAGGSPLPAPLGEAPYPRWALGDGDLALLETYRQGRVAAVAERWTGDRSTARIRDYLESLRRVDAIRANSDTIVDALVLGQAPDLESQATLSVELLARNICHSVFLAHNGDFDTHAATYLQHGLFDSLFGTLGYFADALEAANLFDDTLVVVMSEFTRTPYRNNRTGKDHWPYGSAMIFGGGTVGGQSLGRSDDYLQALPVDLETGLPDDNGSPLTYGCFIAGLLERIDVDPAEWIPEVTPWRGGT